MSTEGKNKVLVVGATGRCGVLAVQKLIASHADTTVLYRSQAKLNAAFGDSANKIKSIKCDLSDKNDINKIELKNYDSILIASGATDMITPVRFIRILFGWFWPTHPYYVEYDLVNTLVQSALQQNHSIKIVIISSFGEYQPWLLPTLILNGLLCGVMKYKHMANQVLRGSELDYTILMPTGLLDTKKQNVTLRFFQKNQDHHLKKPLLSTIARSTVAQLAVDACLKTDIPKQVSINIWEQDRNSEGGFLFAWDKVESDPSPDIYEANFDWPYYGFLSFIVVATTAIVSYKYPQSFNKIKSLIWK